MQAKCGTSSPSCILREGWLAPSDLPSPSVPQVKQILHRLAQGYESESSQQLVARATDGRQKSSSSQNSAAS